MAIQRRWDHPPRHLRGEAIGCHPARPCPKPQERFTQAEAYRCGPLILYPNAPRPSYADQVLSFYRNLGVEPNVAFEVRQLWTVLGLVPAGVGIALVPSSVRRLGRDDIEYLILDEPEISSPIIMSCRTNDRSPLLAHFLKLLDEFDEWTETKVAEFS